MFYDCIIIGGGPSIYDYNHLEQIAKSDYQGPLIITDLMLKPCLEAGITPDKFKNFYVCSLEDGEWTVPLFNHDIISNYKGITLYLSPRSNNGVEPAAREHGIKEIIQLNDSTFDYISNCGLMCWYIAAEYFKINHIILVGMDHAYGVNQKLKLPIDKEETKIAIELLNNPHTKSRIYLGPLHSFWRYDFMLFRKRYPYVETINCSEHSSLFGDKIKWSHLNQYLRN